MSAEVGVSTAPRDDAPGSGIAHATAIIALGNITSRFLGLIRESVLASLFGAGLAMDAYRIAVVVPRGLFDLLIGGHVNSALIPVLSAYAEREDRNDLWRLISALLCILVILMSALIIGIELFAPTIIRIVASEQASAEKVAEATRLLRITAPALMFMSLFAVISSLLYALQRFTFPAFAATVFNLTIVVTMFALAGQIGIEAAAFGWLLGAIVQLLLQGFGLRGVQLHLRPILFHPGVRRIALLYVPVMLSLSLDVLINRPFSYNLASRTGEGAVSIMDFATTLVQFPHGLVATAISIAVLPTLSRQAGTLPEFKKTLSEGLRLSLTLILPATVGLIVFAVPIVGLIFERGEFTAADTQATALALRLYMIGLPFAALDLLLIFAFYARQDTVTPAAVGVVSLIAYMVTAIYLLPYYSFFALMIADSIKHLTHASISGYLLMRRIGGFQGEELVSTTLKASIAALVMGILGGILLTVTADHLTDQIMVQRTIQVFGIGGTCGIVYFVLADRLGLEQIRQFITNIRGRL
jgi:putative peptidoglycan lipid II flippase